MFLLNAALQAPAITISDEGSAITGSKNYSLICTITILFNIVIPTILWRLPSGTVFNASITSVQDYYYYSRLPLTPLTSHAEGDYTCTAYYAVGGVGSPEASKDYHVTVQTPAPTDDVSVTVRL